MSGKSPKDPTAFLNGLLALGALLVVGAVAGLAATAVTEASAQPFQASAESLSSGGMSNRHGRDAQDGSGLHPERIGGKYGYADAAGNLVIPPLFDAADGFSEGLAVVLSAGRFGYIDARGAFAIPAVYRHARAFRDGFAAVRSDRDWLTLDRGGNPVVAELSPIP
jgi:hypothetical protein